MRSLSVVMITELFCISNALSFLDLHDWFTYKFQHAKMYNNFIKVSRRMNIFLENKLKVLQHNVLYDEGKVSYRMSLNEYSDLTNQEFATEMNGLLPSSELRSNSTNANRIMFNGAMGAYVPDAIDWRKKGAVTNIKNQGRCGSCWSFSTTGALEGQHFMKTGELVPLSEQNLIDCSRSYGNQGCRGGLMDQAFSYIRSNGGIDAEESYPYEGTDGVCRYNRRNSVTTVRDFVDIPEGDEGKLKEAIGIVGPVSVAIDASNESFRHYASGIYKESNCGTHVSDHGVLAVGYGTDENGDDYYIVKNSWGTTWGDQGFIKMSRNFNNHCGIATSASYPLV